MKSLIKYSFALATILLMTSCAKENLESAGTGATVTFAVELPGTTATKSTVVEDGSLINNLVYAVYRTEAETEKEAFENIDPTKFVYSVNPKAEGEVTKFEGNKTNVTLELVDNQKYVVLFWAQRNQTWVTGKDFDLTNITYPSKLTANDSKYEAFCGAAYVKEVRGSRKGSVSLTRPFAQINLASTDPEKYDVDITTSSVKIEGAASSFNVATKKASGDLRTLEYVEAENPEGRFGEYEHYVAMNYIFANPVGENSDVVKVTCTINTENHGEGIIKEISNVPVAQNYKTNIVGNLLTSELYYTVEISDEWTRPANVIEIKSVSSAFELVEAIEEASADGIETNIKLNAEEDADGNKVIDLNDLASQVYTRANTASYGLYIPYGKSLIIDLNGCILTQTVEQSTNYSMIQNDGTLTIIDSEGSGQIIYTDSGNGGEYVSNTIMNRGTLVVKGGTIKNYSSETVAENGYPYAIDSSIWGEGVSVTNIEGGEIYSSYSSLRVRADSPTEKVEANITGGKIYGRVDMQMASSTAGAKGILNISGGEFYLYGITKNSIKVFGQGVDTDASGVLVNISGGKFYAPVTVSHEGYGPIGNNFNEKFIYGGEFAAECDPSAYCAVGYSVKSENGVYIIYALPNVAKIGDELYCTLNAAIEAVNDGETITLIADETFTRFNYTHNSDTWYDGVYYVGDKSFTLDLGGYTISQDGSVNDYLLNFKNVGSKENVITLKNGTVDAGTTAYCALCTSSVQENKLTINLENITLYNKNSNGSTAKIRGNAELNVKAGTKIIGTDSYLAIESSASTVNIYDGAELYMQGSTSYNGCLVGVGANGIINVYGGYGKGKKGGFIAMTSGGTINISGGEWIANTDGTIGDNSNLHVLTAQSNSNESGFAGGSYIKVTGGTFRGGMDAWVLNASKPEEDAGLSISGGNFNANPTSFLAEGCEVIENDGIWTVKVIPEATIADDEYDTFEAAVAAAKAGETITLVKDVNLEAELTLPAGITLNGNGKQINGTVYAGGDLTFVGHTKVTSFSASYYDRVITIGVGACLEITGGGRVSLAYGNVFNITGSVENAKTADKANIQPSLIIPAGISITGGSDATLNVTNAYVKIGGTSTKNNSANGTFTLNFDNAIAEFTDYLTVAEPTSGKNPTIKIGIKNSVLTTGTKLIVAAPKSEVVVDNSIITLATYFRNSGKFELKNGSVLTGSTIQFGENGGNDGTTIVDNSTLTITASSTGHALDGKKTGKIVLKNNAVATVTYIKDLTVEKDETSTFTGTDITPANN